MDKEYDVSSLKNKNKKQIQWFANCYGRREIKHIVIGVLLQENKLWATSHHHVIYYASITMLLYTNVFYYLHNLKCLSFTWSCKWKPTVFT